MQHLAWFLDLKKVKTAVKRGEITLLSADHGLDGKKEFPKGKYTKQDKPRRCAMQILESKKKKSVCAHCGYTADGRFEANICPKCGLTYWKCTKCNYLITAAEPPGACPACAENCAFINVTCYTPDCGGPGNVDRRLLHDMK
jgi:rubredoxin/ribosomal protein L37E